MATQGMSVWVELGVRDNGFKQAMQEAADATSTLSSKAKTAASNGASAGSALESAGAKARASASGFKSATGAISGIKSAVSGIKGATSTAAKALKSMGSTGKNAFNTIRNSSNKMNAIKATLTGVRSAGVSAFTTMQSKGVSAANKIKSAFNNMGNSVKHKMSGLKGTFGNFFSGIASGITMGGAFGVGMAAVTALGNGIKSVISTTAEMSKTWSNFDSTMRIVHGDTKKTTKYIKKNKKALQDYAAKTIYTSSEMSKTFTQLDAVGTKSTTSLVKGFGNIAAMAENPKQAMKSISEQATQMAAKPMVAWQDFKIMLEQSPAGMSQVAKKMGMSMSELVAAVQDGKVKTEDLFEAMRKIGEDDSMLANAQQYKTLSDAIEGVKDTIALKLTPAFDVMKETALNAINEIFPALSKIDGEALASGLKSSIDTITPYLKTFGEFAGQVFNGLKDAFGAFADGLKSAGIDVAFTRIGDSLSDLMETLGPFIEKILESEPALTFFSTIGKLIGTGFQLASVMIWAAATVIGDFVEFLMTVPEKVESFKTGVSEKFTSVKEGISSKMEAAKNAVANAVSGIKSFLNFDGIFSKVSSAWEKVRNAIESPINKAKDTVSKAMQAIRDAINNVKAKISIKVPKISVSGGKAPWGIGGKGSLPSFHVSWMAKGGIVNSPTLIGAGEAGPEAIVPLKKLTGIMADALQMLAVPASGQNLAGAGNITINVPLYVNGKKFAEATVDDMTAAQNKLETRASRKRGVR